MTRSRGVLLLALAGFLFGSTFLVVQGAIEDVAVVPFLAARFLIGGAVLWPIARRRASTPNELRHGLIAGGCLLVGFIFQTVGLQSTTASASAFITYLLVVFVPLITAARRRRLPTRAVTVGVALSVVGLVLLSGGASGFGRGEQLTLCCAIAFAAHIVVLGEVSAHHDPVRLTMWQVLTVGAACLIPGFFADGGYAFPLSAWGAAVFCGVGATAVAFWCMSAAQRVVPESQASIVLLLEPVSAGILGAIAGDALGWKGALGAALILAAVLIAELGDRRPVAVGGELALSPYDDVVEPFGGGEAPVASDR
jgi:drug/metabolite transporter (DMT)-like permease